MRRANLIIHMTVRRAIVSKTILQLTNYGETAKKNFILF